MNNDLQSLPKLRDSISYVYIEHAIIEQEDSSIVAIREDGRIAIPVSSVTCLMLGPGTSVTHAAVKAAAENGCMIVWCGEEGMIETKPGVFVGSLNALVREKIWQTIADYKMRGALMVYSCNNEQGYRIEILGEPTRTVVDLDGIQLIKTQ